MRWVQGPEEAGKSCTGASRQETRNIGSAQPWSFWNPWTLGRSCGSQGRRLTIGLKKQSLTGHGPVVTSLTGFRPGATPTYFQGTSSFSAPHSSSLSTACLAWTLTGSLVREATRRAKSLSPTWNFSAKQPLSRPCHLPCLLETYLFRIGELTLFWLWLCHPIMKDLHNRMAPGPSASPASDLHPRILQVSQLP